MGTLLENIVVVEAFRVLSQRSSAGAIELASSFAMPPLSIWTQHQADACFSATQMDNLRRAHQPRPDSYAGLMWNCVQQPPSLSGPMGPSGTLLCAMLASRVGRPLRMWLNDIAEGRYGNALPALAAISDTVQIVLGLTKLPRNRVVICATAYPASLAPPASDNLETTLGGWPSDAPARLGFVDPMRYRITGPGAGETSSVDHQRWLRLLAAEFSGLIASVHFTGHRNWAQLRREVEQICADGIAQRYAHAVTASHDYYHVITVIRDPRGAALALATARALGQAIEAEWRAWCHAIRHDPACMIRVTVE